MEEVTKLSKSMVNDLTKVKQGQTALNENSQKDYSLE